MDKLLKMVRRLKQAYDAANPHSIEFEAALQRVFAALAEMDATRPHFVLEVQDIEQKNSTTLGD